MTRTKEKRAIALRYLITFCDGPFPIQMQYFLIQLSSQGRIGCTLPGQATDVE